MKPFTIRCTTCGVGLTVRNESAIGHILSCPKCGSMVEVQRPVETPEPPAAHTPSPMHQTPLPTSPVGDISESFEQTLEDALSLISDKPPVTGTTPKAPKKPEPTPPKPAPSKSDIKRQKAREIDSIVGVAAESLFEAGEEVSKKEEALREAMRKETQLKELARKKKIQQAKAAIAQKQAAEKEASAQEKAPSEPTTQEPSASPTSSQFKQPPPRSESEVAPLIPKWKTPPVDTSEPPPSPPPVVKEPPPAVPHSEDPLEAPAFGPEWETASKREWRQFTLYAGAGLIGALVAIGLWFGAVALFTDPGDPGKTVEQPPADTPGKGDLDNKPDDITPPPDQDPENPPVEKPDTDPNQGTGETPDPIENPDDTGTPPDDDNLFPVKDPDDTQPDDNGTPDDPPVVDPDDEQPPEKPPVEDVSPQPQRPRPPAQPVDVAQHLKDRIPAIQFESMPLVDFLNLMTVMSTIPITFDPEGSAAANVTAFTPVSLNLRDTNIEEILKKGLDPRWLTWQVAGDNLIVQKRPSNGKPMRTLPCEVEDLTGGDPAQLDLLEELTRELVAPGTWFKDGGQGKITKSGKKLEITQTEPNHLKAIILRDKLRIARGGKQVSKFNAKFFNLTPRTEQAAKTLGTKTSLNYYHPTPLLKVLDRLQHDTGLRFPVDWRALSAEGWPVDSNVQFVARDVPLSETLDLMLVPMDLAWRVIDGKTIQITSQKALDKHLELEFYKVSDLVAPGEDATLLNTLRNKLGTERFLGSGGQGVLRFDPQSKCIMALLSQPDQRRLARLLEEMQADKG